MRELKVWLVPKIKLLIQDMMRLNWWHVANQEANVSAWAFPTNMDMPVHESIHKRNRRKMGSRKLDQYKLTTLCVKWGGI